MRAQHTPGPWYSIPATGLIFGLSDGGKIAQVATLITGWLGQPLSQRAADAALIAAAPDLLAACERMIPANVCLTNRNVRDDAIVALDVPIGELRAIAGLIAKARGEA